MDTASPAWLELKYQTSSRRNSRALVEFLSDFEGQWVYTNEQDVRQPNIAGEYVKDGSESAFRELVNRYVDLVYSTALRLMSGDTHLAEDVTRTVFLALARKAHLLHGEPMLGGWLHQHTRFVAAKLLRGENRRRARGGSESFQGLLT